MLASGLASERLTLSFEKLDSNSLFVRIAAGDIGLNLAISEDLTTLVVETIEDEAKLSILVFGTFTPPESDLQLFKVGMELFRIIEEIEVARLGFAGELKLEIAKVGTTLSSSRSRAVQFLLQVADVIKGDFVGGVEDLYGLAAEELDKLSELAERKGGCEHRSMSKSESKRSIARESMLEMLLESEVDCSELEPSLKSVRSDSGSFS